MTNERVSDRKIGSVVGLLYPKSVYSLHYFIIFEQIPANHSSTPSGGNWEDGRLLHTRKVVRSLPSQGIRSRIRWSSPVPLGS